MTRSAPCGALALLLLAPGLALAQVDALEAVEGPTLMSALAGDGGLTVGVAPTGELTQLLWPDPFGAAQIHHRTAASANARELPRFGAERTDGLLVGLWIERGDGSELTWLRNEPWEHSQAYSGAAIVQTSERADLGLRVFVTASARGDGLVLRTALERDDGSPVLDAWVVVFADVSPGGADWLAYWDPTGDRVIAFSPTDGGDEPRGALLAGDWTAEAWRGEGLGLAEDIATGRPGVHLAFGGDTPSGVHVGARTGQDCVPGAGWAHPPSAWDAVAASLTSGTSEGAPVAACDADAALSWPVEWKDDGPTDRGAVDFFLAAAPTAVAAASRLDGLRDLGFDALVAAANASASESLDRLVLPTGVGTGERAAITSFAERWARTAESLVDVDTGAIAASAASQPLFHVDRPWESAWTELALEVTGDFDSVSRHQRWLVEQQVTAPVLADGSLRVPPGAWTTDRGPFDMAQVGLTAWSFWRHAQYAGNGSKARTTLAAAWPALSAAADLLTTCVADDHPALAVATAERPDGFPAWWPLLLDLQAGIAPDAAAGLTAAVSGAWDALRPCDSWEGGAATPDATLLSTHLARLGLLAAGAPRDALCLDDPRAEAWQARADELGALLLAADFDGASWTGKAPLLTWPAPLEIAPAWRFAFATSTDPEAQEAEVTAYVQQALSAWVVQEHARAVAAITLETDGRGDEALALLAGAGWSTGAADERLLPARARAMLTRLVTKLTTPTGHLGGAFVAVETPVKGADQRVGQPHLPAASQAVLALIAYDQPELLTPAAAQSLELTCPDGEEPDLLREAPACGSDCQSSLAGRPEGAASLAAVLGLLGLALRRRRVRP